MKKSLLIAALVMIALPAMSQAKPRKFTTSVQGVLGFNAEADVDKVEVKQNGGTNKGDGDDEDVESNLGLLATVDFELQPNVRVGARGAFMVGEGDDTEADYTTFDAGAFGRYMLSNGKTKPFINGALGLTYAKAKVDAFQGFNEDEFTGFGWHLVVGGGVEAEVNGVNVIAMLNYSRQTANLEAEDSGTTVTFEDAVISRLLLSAGVTF